VSGTKKKKSRRRKSFRDPRCVSAHAADRPPPTNFSSPTAADQLLGKNFSPRFGVGNFDAVARARAVGRSRKSGAEKIYTAN
jgi:hypothetical protein